MGTVLEWAEPYMVPRWQGIIGGHLVWVGQPDLGPLPTACRC